MVDALAGPLLIVARMLMGALFIVGGLRHFWLLDPISAAMRARGVPMARTVLITGSVYEVAFGVLLALSVTVSLAALALVVFTILATVMMVNFWDKPEPERGALFGIFMSNLAIVGGLLGLAASG